MIHSVVAFGAFSGVARTQAPTGSARPEGAEGPAQALAQMLGPSPQPLDSGPEWPARATRPDPGKAPELHSHLIDSLDPRRMTDALVAMRRELGEIDAKMRAISDRLGADDKSPFADPEYQRLMQDRQGQMLDFQLEIQNLSFQTELASKVIEHATTSTKNVLQTQA